MGEGGTLRGTHGGYPWEGEAMRGGTHGGQSMGGKPMGGTHVGDIHGRGIPIKGVLDNLESPGILF